MRLIVLLCCLLILPACAGVDPMLKRALERNRQVWEEDRREDLDPELIKSRVREFDAQLEYLESK